MPNNHVEGIGRPNFVVVFDNEYRFQFRVQCEVPVFDEKEAMKLVGHLKAKTLSEFAKAKPIVDAAIADYDTKNPDKKISELSIEIINKSFEEKIGKSKPHLTGETL